MRVVTAEVWEDSMEMPLPVYAVGISFSRLVKEN
jgi:hypothetical protein